MTTLEYYWEDGTHTTFTKYTIDEYSVIKNERGYVMSQNKNKSGYNKITLTHEGNRRNIYVARALASTFLGPPPTLQHTADHKDKNSLNDTLANIRWFDKSDQGYNRDMPEDFNSAFIIENNGVDLTVKEWVKVYKKPNGEQYHENTIKWYAQHHKHGFRYKVFPNLQGEVWRPVPVSRSKKGEWFISNMNRMKYKTVYAENVLTVGQMTKKGGYPSVHINGKQWKCHYLSMMTFRPREYAAKFPGDVILHKYDDPLDFNPFRLRWGTQSENVKDAHKNGKFEGTKSAKKPVASYINGVLEQVHESLNDAAKYLQVNGYTAAQPNAVNRAFENDGIRYGRTWKCL